MRSPLPGARPTPASSRGPRLSGTHDTGRGSGRRSSSMIARLWTGRTKDEDYDPYPAYLEESGVAALKPTAGNRGVMVLRRLHGAEAEFSVMSFWDSLDDVKKFAGDDVDAARYFPDDERFLLDFPPRLKHFEVAREREVLDPT